MTRNPWLVLPFAFGLLGLLAGCGDDPAPEPKLPYNPGSTTVIGGGADGTGGGAAADGSIDSSGAIFVASTPSGDGCIDLDGECVQPQLTCDDPKAAADVLVGENGEVLDVICFPTGGVSVETFEGSIEDLPNNAVLVVDDKDDGVDVMGDITVDGNNIVIYGYGPDTSVIGGSVHLDMNNAIVRGVRIQGDVTIDKNNPSMIDCVIEGDLIISGNNVSMALCEVWGTVTITGNNTIFVSNRFLSAPELEGKHLDCNDNRLFTDPNEDGHVSDDELGDPLDCTDHSGTAGAAADAGAGSGKKP